MLASRQPASVAAEAVTESPDVGHFPCQLPAVYFPMRQLANPLKVSVTVLLVAPLAPLLPVLSVCLSVCLSDVPVHTHTYKPRPPSYTRSVACGIFSQPCTSLRPPQVPFCCFILIGNPMSFVSSLGRRRRSYHFHTTLLKC